MAEYRVFLLNRSGAIVSRLGFECERDDEAILGARDAAEGYTVEVWSGTRLVMLLDAQRQRTAT